MISYFENSFMRTAPRHEGVPELTDLQKHALQAFEDLADSTELRMDYVLQPGDIQLLHNHSIVHARTAYVDHDDVSGHSYHHACMLLQLHSSAASAMQPERLDQHVLPITIITISLDNLQAWLVQCAWKLA